MDLSPREIETLATVVEEYIATALPVGSRTVSRRSSLGLSAASIRNTMADLTEKGLLDQPHTSAGRIPSIAGLRHYLNTILTLSPLPPGQQRTIADDMGREDDPMDDILRQASRLLSSLSNQVGMVIPPRKSMVRWQQMDFVLVRPGMVMSILVLQGGLLRNKIIRVDQDITSDDLIQYGNYLNELFRGRTLTDVRALILGQMENARRRFDTLYRRAMNLARAVCDDDERCEIYVEGQSNLLDHPEFTDLENMRSILRLLEEKSRLLELLDKTFESPGVRVILGKEDGMDLDSCCFIVSSYAPDSSLVGTVGLVGPIRMDYAKVLPIVDFTARVLTRLLKSRFD
ncbi:MAG: heat-inducible transcription repressor HrcA [Deltaproteobacteria bacterium]|nr:heat-inducible transcription repressor HrcA [Deltaproteobacteria bacterium]